MSDEPRARQDRWLTHPALIFGSILGIGLAVRSARRAAGNAMAGEGFARELLIHLCIFLPLGLVAGRIWYRLMVGAGFGHREEDEQK